MKILHINTTDIEGGAARAAYRLHKALLAEGIDSQMLVQKKLSDDYTVQTVAKTKIGKFLNFLRPYIDALPLRKYKHRTKTLFSPAWVPFSKVVDRINEINPDIVHLHWICGGMIRIEDLAKIKQPIVWTMHDMWPFTGGEHYDEEQQHYIEKCGNSRVLNSHKENDLSKRTWKRKNKTYLKINSLNTISPSQWMYEEVKKSSLLKNKTNHLLANILNTNIFKPIPKEIARELWNLPKEKKLILFGAIAATSDDRKGFNLLINALKSLDIKNAEIIIFGSSKPKEENLIGNNINYVGHLHDDISLVSLYSSADVMIVPSKQESFGQTASEAMACGTPVVAFNTTGLKDIIDHKINGYLAEPFNSEDLKNGIEWILNNENYETLSKNARKKIVSHFSEEVLIPKYIELYKEILAHKN
jgi:glycosyltransferase, group 1 family